MLSKFKKIKQSQLLLTKYKNIFNQPVCSTQPAVCVKRCLPIQKYERQQINNTDMGW